MFVVTAVSGALTALLFLSASLLKLTDQPQAREGQAKFGISAATYKRIGVLELLGVIGVLVGLAVPGDGGPSRQHAVLEPLAPGWCVRDLGSSNGTFVNGERIIRDRALRNGDEVRVGDTRLVFRADQLGEEEAMTLGPERPPDL